MYIVLTLQLSDVGHLRRSSNEGEQYRDLIN